MSENISFHSLSWSIFNNNTFTRSLLDDIFQVVDFGEVIKDKEVETKWFTGDGFQLILIQVISDTNGHHSYTSIMSLQCFHDGLRWFIGFSISQYNPNLCISR